MEGGVSARLRWAAAGTVALMVLITLVATAFGVQKSHQQREAAHVVDVAGQQRMLTQRMASQVAALADERLSAERRSAASSVLVDAAAELRAIAAGLQHGDTSRRLPNQLPEQVANLYSVRGADLHSRIVLFTDAALRAAEPGAELAPGTALRERIDAEAQTRLSADLDRVVRSLAAEADEQAETSRRWLLVALGLVLVTAISHMLFVVRPLTRSLLAEQREAARSAKQLREAAAFTAGLVDGMDVALIAVDASGEHLTVNAAARRQHGLPETGPVTKETLLNSAELRDPETGESIGVAQLPLSRALAGVDNETQITLYTPGLDPRRLVIRARALYGDDGALLGAVSATQDVTQLHSHNRLLTRHASQLAAISEASRAVLLEDDARGALCRVACSVTEAVMATLFEPDGHGDLVCTASVGPDIEGLRISLHEPSMTAEAFHSVTTRTTPMSKDTPGLDHSLVARLEELCGQQLTMGAWVPVVMAGRCVGVLALGYGVNVSSDLIREQLPVLQVLAAETAVALERQALLHRLEAQAGLDPLTGVGNRRTWEETLPIAMATAARTGASLSVMILDFDRFKAYNDSHGHLAGDALLRDTLQLWQQRLRPADVLCRYGGEEFTILLPGCTATDAHVVADSLRALVPGGQSCSAGVAQWDGYEPSDALLNRADRALYVAKATGRNKVFLA